jgi:hypothetical protein
MLVYEGIPERIGRGGFKVLKNGKVLSPKPSQKLYNHSPDGFAWGYGGSGPAQLALALLYDATGDKGLALHNYQIFKWEIIAKFPMGLPWKLTEVEIGAWL